MKKAPLFTILLLLINAISYSQNLEVDGHAKITQMDDATSNAQAVMKEDDGTLTVASMSSPTYSIGDYAQGGVVFWVSPDGKHGKVVSITEIEKIAWSNVNALTGITNTKNGAGNTVKIIKQTGHTKSAAQLCIDFSYEGFHDWYLPSIDEGSDISTYFSDINDTINIYEGDPLDLVSNIFWLSNDIDFSGTALAHAQVFGGTVFVSKSSLHYVRPVRAF